MAPASDWSCLAMSTAIVAIQGMARPDRVQVQYRTRVNTVKRRSESVAVELMAAGPRWPATPPRPLHARSDPGHPAFVAEPAPPALRWAQRIRVCRPPNNARAAGLPSTATPAWERLRPHGAPISSIATREAFGRFPDPVRKDGPRQESDDRPPRPPIEPSEQPSRSGRARAAAKRQATQDSALRQTKRG